MVRGMDIRWRALRGQLYQLQCCLRVFACLFAYGATFCRCLFDGRIHEPQKCAQRSKNTISRYIKKCNPEVASDHKVWSVSPFCNTFMICKVVSKW